MIAKCGRLLLQSGHDEQVLRFVREGLAFVRWSSGGRICFGTQPRWISAVVSGTSRYEIDL
jgi:hypothetical protein